MPITLDWVNVACLLGAAQGLLLAVVLMTKHANRTANRLLSVLMITFSIYLFSAVYNAAGWIHTIPQLFGLAYPLPLVFGPLVYLYAIHASDGDRRFGARDVLHFAPVTAAIILTLPIYFESGAAKIELSGRLFSSDAPPLLEVINWLKYVSGVSYTAATLRHLARHRSLVKDSYSSIEQVNLRWLLFLRAAPRSSGRSRPRSRSRAWPTSRWAAPATSWPSGSPAWSMASATWGSGSRRSSTT